VFLEMETNEDTVDLNTLYIVSISINTLAARPTNSWPWLADQAAALTSYNNLVSVPRDSGSRQPTKPRARSAQTQYLTTAPQAANKEQLHLTSLCRHWHNCALIFQPQFYFSIPAPSQGSLQKHLHVTKLCPAHSPPERNNPTIHNAVFAPPKHSVAHHITSNRLSTILYTPLYG
jgi:hypothetical protein